MGWYARKLGLQTNAITGAEIVTADGAVRWVDATTDPDLFWALRGGGGNLGIVTELEFRCFDFTTAYAGMLIWDITRAEDVLRAFAAWAPTAPDEVTTSLRFLQLPPLEMIPEPLRGRRIVVIDGAVMDDDCWAEKHLAPFRDLGPEIDTFTRVPTETLIRLHMDPEEPVPVVSRTASLAGLPADAVTALLDAAGPQAQTSLLMVELRQLGGALGRSAPEAGALPSLDGSFVLFAGAMAIDADTAAAGERDAKAICAAMAPWSNDRLYLNFAEQATDTSRGYSPADYSRLVAVRESVDPNGLFVANHRV
jgi:FAD/FMN-containing dehydrogenase